MEPARSYLYVPGHRADLIPKALASEADSVVVDLEDAVPSEEKAVARQNAIALLDSVSDRVWIRLNNVRSREGMLDLNALAEVRVPSLRVRLAKCESEGDVLTVANA